jgi:cytochrome c-type biogenesis protein CcmH
MTAAAVLAVLWPLSRPRAVAHGGDAAVYRDQLEELERDKRSGLVALPEAETARVEIARRLLNADSRRAPGGPEQDARGTWRRRVVTVATLTLVPAGAAALYLALGAPTLSQGPRGDRQAGASETQSIQALVSQVEKHLERSPEDGRGWEVLAPVYIRLGRLADAVQARQNALRLLGATATREADYGEALTLAANGIVTADARGAFERAVKADGAELKARFFLGVAAEQDGRLPEAASIWRKLLTEAPAEAPWRGLVQQALARVDPAGAKDAAGPTRDDVAAAEELTPDQRTGMVRGMVERLATKLREDGSDVHGWERLVRSYVVLGEAEKAKAAATAARQALAADQEKLSQINALIRQLGLES